MIIISKEYALKADQRCFTICKKGKREGKASWEPEFYFTDLNHVFQKLISLAIVKGVNKGSWDEVKKEVKKTREMIESKMDILTSIKIPNTTSGESREETILKNKPKDTA